MKHLLIGAAMLMGALSLGSSANAQPNTCQGFLNMCRKECPAAMQKGAPAGCTCQERFATCKVTKAWPSWRGGSSFPVKG